MKHKNSPVTKAIFCAIAPEYLNIDDEGWPGPGELEEWKIAGANYAMNLPNEKKKLMPVGEFNSTKIVVNGSLIQHYLNGEVIVEYKHMDRGRVRTEEFREMG